MSSRPSHFVLTQPGKQRLYSTSELLRLPAPEYLIDKVIPENSFVGLYGAPGHGKSFVAIDLALCVGSGRPWFGHAVRQGLAVYISAEGGAGISKRVATWLEHYRVPGTDAHVAWMTEAVTVEEESDDIERLISRLEDEIQIQPALFVVDTLARCFNGNENQQEDMGRFVRGVDRLRRSFQSAVLAVHHTRQDEGRERGSTAFRGAADTMIAVSKNADGLVQVRCDKQKDDGEFDQLTLRMKVNEDFNSVVLVNDSDDATEHVLMFLQGHPKGLSYSAIEDLATTAGVSRSTLKRRLKTLLTSGRVKREEGIYQWQPIR
jgi:RecA-family ATPase